MVASMSLVFQISMSVWEILLAMKTANVSTSMGDFTVDATAATSEMEWRTAQV